ncbi:hypothetical protein [Pseudophaeobacter sp.]|uniref:hypothetical protein n=1 Tax=Pseudophaeobacter sp. TaxID=1971739 RepID=UPI003299D359
MRLLFSLLLSISAASIGHARELIAEIQVEGKEALIFDDGFWRYDDSVGEVCTPTLNYGSICSLPSIWSPLPKPKRKYAFPEFVQGEFVAKFRVLQLGLHGKPTVDDVMTYIDRRTIYNGLQGAVLLDTNANFGTLEGRVIVIQAGSNGVFAFTFANQNGRYLIAETRDPTSSLYHSWHRKAHSSFVEAVRSSPFEGD